MKTHGWQSTSSIYLRNHSIILLNILYMLYSDVKISSSHSRPNRFLFYMKLTWLSFNVILYKYITVILHWILKYDRFQPTLSIKQHNQDCMAFLYTVILTGQSPCGCNVLVKVIACIIVSSNYNKDRVLKKADWTSYLKLVKR